MSDNKNEKHPSCTQIINMLPEPFVVIDRDYRIISANSNYLKHYGHNDPEGVIGHYCYEISHHVDAPCSQHGEHCPLETVFETKKATQVMHVHYDQDGNEEHVQLQANPLCDDDGSVLYVGEYIYPVAKPSEDTFLVGRSPTMLRMTSLLQRVAPTQTTVLLQGESGTGKECVSQYLHQFSLRSGLPFVIVDCATLGENLIESELFGHEKGSFTGASVRKKGLFEAANGGTLFIDEIGELPLHLQTKLLRALETGTIRRIGGTEYIKIDVRVIAATNKDLQQMVADGDFRQDLYYRLTAFPVTIPSLRERPDDIAALAEHFISLQEDGDRFVPLQPQVIEKLLSYDYPGNVRELRNIVERAVILAYGEEILKPDHLVFDETKEQQTPLPTAEQPVATDANKFLNRRHGKLTDVDVLSALQRFDGHRADAARDLGVSERTLYRYVQRMREAEQG